MEFPSENIIISKLNKIRNVQITINQPINSPQISSSEAETEKINKSHKKTGKNNLISFSGNLETENSEDENEKSQIFVEGLTGMNSEYVILVSSDFHEFIIKRAAAYMSPTLKVILNTSKKTISEVFISYPSLVVSKIVEYLIFKEYYERSQEDAPKFSVDPTIVLEVLLASQFLDI